MQARLKESQLEQGGRLFQGNVFVDNEAICDDHVGQTRGQFRGKLLSFSARCFLVLGIRY